MGNLSGILVLFSMLLVSGCLQEGIENNDASPRPMPPSSARQVSRPVAPRSPQAAEAPSSSSNVVPEDALNERLINWYSQRSNYELVLQDVRSFYAPVRDNGCVAFVSAALRRIGVAIPLSLTNRESPSLITRALSQYLEREWAWVRVNSAHQLRPGDIVFTRDNPSYPGYPAHTYVFQGWSQKSLGIALVIDNQDFTHERNIYDNDTPFNFTPFAYALRAP